MTRGAARTRLSASWVLVRLLVICGIVWLPACSALESIPLPFLAATTPTSLPSDATPTPDETIRVTDTPTPLPPDELALWLPPEFDPASGSRAGDLLQARIAAFEEANDIRVSVRIKSATGAGGLLAALSAASAAAPLSLPGVIALPRTEFESAAIKGFLLPLEGLSPALNEEDWFGYARELALVEGVPFGLPFAGDALALVYRPSQVNGSLVTWDNILEQGQPLGIAVGSPLGFSTLVFYGSVGGQFEDAQRRPMLQVDPLTTVLEFYRLGASRGLFPTWLADLTSEELVWQAYKDQKVNACVVWTSHFLQDGLPDSLISPLPALGERESTLASGWVWAVADPLPERQAVSVALVEWLSDVEFIAQWSEASGFLPTRSLSMSSWQDQTLRTVLGRVAATAHARPSNELITSLGPVMAGAVTRVIRSDVEPSQVALDAVDALANP